MMQEQLQKPEIVQAGVDDLAALARMGAELGFIEHCLMDEGKDVFMLRFEGQEAGYCLLNRQPKYAYYKAEGIPEIQDLNVLPALRRRGFGRALIEYCEALARGRGFAQMGISVGLHAGFGAAQRLYVRLGYVPDGYGVTYDRSRVLEGEFKPVDDQLCLMMVKRLI